MRTAAALLALTACASAPPRPPDPLPLEEPDTTPAVALFVQRAEDAERLHAFQEQVQARQPATFHLEHTARDGSLVVEDVTYDGARFGYAAGQRRLACLYLSGARLSGCRELAPAGESGPVPDPLEHLGE